MWQQPWPTKKAIDAALQDWPEDQPTMDITMADAHKRVDKAFSDYLQEHHPEEYEQLLKDHPEG